ncbi:MAG TPA: hypothetical protein VMV76_07380 [Dehalococcoidia bacterium]|jgi:hypothetical protein|nr:hypothetical protein [Dehalococcoidia bacterium]
MSSLASGGQKSQIANDLAIFNTHRIDKYGTIEFITDGERLWLRFIRNEGL